MTEKKKTEAVAAEDILENKKVGKGDTAPTAEERKLSIWVTTGYIDKVINNAGSDLVQGFLKCGIPAKPGYWIGRCLDKMEPIAKRIMKEKGKLAENFAELDKEGKVKIGKQGGITLDAKKVREYGNAVEPILENWENLGIRPIDLDLEELEQKDILVAPGEWWIVIPLLKEIAQE